MTSFRKAQTGKRVYNGASTSPNKGRVSAKGALGYIKREQDKKNKMNRKRLMGGRPVGNMKGSDGKSDMRSTIAAKALKRRRAMNSGY